MAGPQHPDRGTGPVGVAAEHGTGHERPATRAARRDEPAPPPVGGVLWTVAGDVRALLMLPAALTMQVAHPAIGAGVDDHSVFRSDPWGRGERSLRSLQLWIYGGAAAAEEGRRLRALHKEIQGTDAHGRRYHALTPAYYAWVHATGYPVYRHGLRYLARPLTEAQDRQLYAEWLQVGRVLGIHDRDMPQTIEEFWPYYRRVLAEEIEATVVVRELLATDQPVPPPDRGPLPVRLALKVLWPLLRGPFLRARSFLTVGLMPPDARAAIGLEWTEAQERRLRRFARVVRAVVPVLPERLRYLPLARKARQEARREALRQASRRQ
ncbi:oxygenase MpaB family protein [Streptomyces sp. NPDC051921]|uniref:oxygenase MpaB family protein n=1 Tax=Streptomyces sp. NPDC051921 TaxID=3155806 RepID=UPI0034475C57